MIQGGAGNFPRHSSEAYCKGLKRALDRGWDVLQSGGSSIAACEEAIVELEDESVFNAGTGSQLNRDGHGQMDAILMDGATLKSGAVASVERVLNPIRLARLVLERSPHMLLTASGAELFAIEHGMNLCDPSALITDREYRLWEEGSRKISKFGTVGAIALDAQGNLAAGTSTGGIRFKFPGRVGDSPLVGCGCYADNVGAAVSTTGEGESCMRVVLAKTANDFVASGHSAQAAADAAVSILANRTTGRGGLIVLDPQGRCGFAFNTLHMAYAFKTSDSPTPTVNA